MISGGVTITSDMLCAGLLVILIFIGIIYNIIVIVITNDIKIGCIFNQTCLNCLLNTGGESGKDACGVSSYLSSLSSYLSSYPPQFIISDLIMGHG